MLQNNNLKSAINWFNIEPVKVKLSEYFKHADTNWCIEGVYVDMLDNIFTS